MQDAHLFLAARGIELRDFLDDRRPAVLDAEHGVRLNHEWYYFADPDSRATFLADPTRFCGLLTDPTTGRRFLPRADSPRAEHDGVVFLFPSHEARRRFELQPTRYALPGRRS